MPAKPEKEDAAKDGDTPEATGRARSTSKPAAEPRPGSVGPWPEAAPPPAGARGADREDPGRPG